MTIKAAAGTLLALATALAAPAPTLAGGPSEAVVKAAGRLAEQLKRNPATPSKAASRNGLYLLDVEKGGVTLIAEEPAPGLAHCGSARWSGDGGRIMFDATPGNRWNQSHLEAIDAGEGGPKRTDLGLGNCPSPAPDGKRVAFLLNSGAVTGAESGVWVMKADGTGRRRLGAFGRPYWSPDGRRLLVVGFSIPCNLSLLDVETGKEQPIRIADQRVDAVPCWAGADALAAVLGTGLGDTIALVDVADPGKANVGEVLWKRTTEADPTPSYPVVPADGRRCVFAGTGPKGMALFSVPKGKAAAATRLEPAAGFDKVIADVAISPDGRYVLFCGDRPARKTP